MPSGYETEPRHSVEGHGERKEDWPLSRSQSCAPQWLQNDDPGFTVAPQRLQSR
jgi:hypothetical protein